VTFLQLRVDEVERVSVQEFELKWCKEIEARVVSAWGCEVQTFQRDALVSNWLDSSSLTLSGRALISQLKTPQPRKHFF